MTLPAWRTIAEPRKDIREGTFVQEAFAADLGSAARNSGLQDYRDPVVFLERTYLTAALERILKDLARRLSGDQSVPGVHRMQTRFGGGKTHTMLAAYHLFRHRDEVDRTDLVRELGEALKGAPIPKAKVVVLDGGALHPGTAEVLHDGTRAHTLLGLLAHGLGGRAAYETVAEQDRQLLASSTTQLTDLLQAHTPCLILLDEALEYLVKAAAVKIGAVKERDLAGTTVTFVKDLCTAISNVPGAAIVATLTSSNDESFSTEHGQRLFSMLEKAVGRTESVVTPIQGDEVFPILQRRLFTKTGSTEERLAVARAYDEYYAKELGHGVANFFRGDAYRARITTAYPFHPALIDILTERWDGIPSYQRTRGALRFLAHTVKALSQRGHDGPLIQPGDVELSDTGVQGEALRVAGPEFTAVLVADITQPDSNAVQVDQRWSGRGTFRVGVGLATTAFLYSPSPEKARGASTEDMLIGVGKPGLSRAVIEGVRDMLDNSLWYMRLERGRYLFSTQANLNRVIIERESTITADRIDALLEEGLGRVARPVPPLRVELNVHHPRDLPDSRHLTLGLLGFRHLVTHEPDSELRGVAEKILSDYKAEYRSHRNAAMLIAADAAVLDKARDTARNLLALRDLRHDRSWAKDLTDEQREQLTDRLRIAEQRLPEQLIVAYRHLLLLSPGANGTARVEHRDLGLTPGDSIGARVLEELRTHERLVDELGPAALVSERFQLLPDGTDALELDQLLNYFSQFPRLPKLASEEVLRTALANGVEQGLFGLVSGSSWRSEEAVVRFRSQVDRREITFQAGTFLVRNTAVEALLASRQPTQPQAGISGPTTEGIPPTTGGTPRGQVGGESGQGPERERPARPRATVPSLQLTVRGVPGGKMREVVRVAVLPLNEVSVGVDVDLVVRADGGMQGIPNDTLSLTVLEGLRQLGLQDVDVQLPGEETR